ncbi:SAM-dependent methyltransferase, type 11 [Candidatus Desulfarcum epimagneticum]|uniref:SAM-dependent methyltransferase, type 11 n=1 Tax=uncultured Desulfobacteraceae bacterium TaxID=218296 RepID=A0A484HGI5_9BACT|nr:SAM-dependent methyltransferase, type 11 [uncultured Desulfobacteraceae bacterium]
MRRSWAEAPSICPLCGEAAGLFFEDNRRIYLRCGRCRLIFVPRRHWMAPEDERAVYDLHENDPRDSGYRRFLSRLTGPLLERLPPRQAGLDFGCGPGPTLSAMLEEKGHTVDLYDPFYQNHPEVFEKQYDFICATEVAEHLRDPGADFTRLFAMLKPGGWLAVMTRPARDLQAFSQWHYIRDMTHICFYCLETFQYMAGRFHAGLEFRAPDVALFRKNVPGNHQNRLT